MLEKGINKNGLQLDINNTILPSKLKRLSNFHSTEYWPNTFRLEENCCYQKYYKLHFQWQN